MRIADIFADRKTLHLAGVEAERLIKEDPTLSAPENKALRAEIAALYKKLNQN